MRAATRPACTLALAGALLLALPGCETNQQTGQVLGGVGGAVLGHQLGGLVGGSNARLIGAAVGAAAGVWVGGAIGQRLDERDRQLAEQATRAALDAPPTNRQPVGWTSNTNAGVSGNAQVVNVARNTAGGECRMVRQVAIVNGQEVTDQQQFCRGADGRWALA